MTHLYRFVDIDQVQQRLLHLRQQLREKQQDLLRHPRRILRRREEIISQSSPQDLFSWN